MDLAAFMTACLAATIGQSTVAALPEDGMPGNLACVSDAASPVINLPIVGGGSKKAVVVWGSARPGWLVVWKE
jgi:hypothetical protein